MKIVRQLIIGLSAFIAIWTGVSFIAVMFDAGNIDFWTTSLVWALLASVVVMPGLVIAHHATQQAKARADREQARQSIGQPTPFVGEADQEDALWPSDAETKNQN
jgi:hypothetical protein